MIVTTIGKKQDASITWNMKRCGNNRNMSNKGKDATTNAKTQGTVMKTAYAIGGVILWRSGHPMAKSRSSDMLAKVNIDAIPDRKSKNQIAALDRSVNLTTPRVTQIYIGTDMDATMKSAQANEISK